MTTQPVPSGRRRIAGERVRRTPATPSAKPSTTLQAEQSVQAEQRSTSPPAWLLAGIAILLAGALVFDVVAMMRQHAAQGRFADARSVSAAETTTYKEVPARAELAATALLSYDFATLEADAAAAEAYLTPAYAATFRKTVDDFLARQAEKDRGRVTAKVMASGVVSATASKAEVLLFVDQTSAGTDTPGDRTATAPGGEAGTKSAQTALNRVVLSMVKDGDAWLVDDVTAL